MKTIYLIRHGEIDSGQPRRFIGRTDLRLTEQGRVQIQRLGKHLFPITFERIFSSPLCRCTETAEILAKLQGVELEVVPDLAEIDLGKWEGLTVAEVREKFPGEYERRGKDMARYTPYDGESFHDLHLRVIQVLKTIVNATDSQTAIVSHAGVNRVLLCHILGIPLKNMFRLQQGYGCYNILHVKNNSISVDCLNVRLAFEL